MPWPHVPVPPIAADEDSLAMELLYEGDEVSHAHSAKQGAKLEDLDK